MRKTAESVTAGHPDKICDQIADALVDECLRRDPNTRAHFRVLGSHGMLVIGGELSSAADFDMAAVARAVYAEIGYADEIEVFVNIDRPTEQVEQNSTVVVNGYATRETREWLPRPLVFAHALTRRIDHLRKMDGNFTWLRPEAVAQVSTDKESIRAITILASHTSAIETRDVKLAVLDRVIVPVIGSIEGVQVHINAGGNLWRAGLTDGAGMSGQKLQMDSYGGLVPFSEQALSGKDPLKPERAGAYAARAAAKYLVEQGMVSSAVVTLVYTSGRAEPISMEAIGVAEKTRGARLNLSELIQTKFDFRPEAIADRFQLRRPLYRDTAAYGHFGRPEFPWEQTLI